jgi:hypothetical protein
MSVAALILPDMTQPPGDDRRFPPALAELARIDFAYVDEESIDFEPYGAFASAEETTGELRLWTGNEEAVGDAFRIFGQDGSGGVAALWLARPGLPLREQPVVFMSSEGQCGVLAGNLSDFLWVMAEGVGPFEAVVFRSRSGRPNAELTELAERHAATPRRSAEEIIEGAEAEFPSFAGSIQALCR